MHETSRCPRTSSWKSIANTTHGFVGADLALMVKEAAMHALRRAFPGMNPDEEISAEKLENPQSHRRGLRIGSENGSTECHARGPRRSS